MNVPHGTLLVEKANIMTSAIGKMIIIAAETKGIAAWATS
jgi:hypothetical protein